MKCGGISMCKKYEHKEMSLILNKTDWWGGGGKIDSPLNLPFSLLTNMLKNRETCCDLCYILFCG